MLQKCPVYVLASIECLMFHIPIMQIPPVAEKGENEFLRFSALSNAGFEMDGLQKTNQDSFISIVNLGGIRDAHGYLSRRSGSRAHQLGARVKPRLITGCFAQESRPSPSSASTTAMAHAAISSPATFESAPLSPSSTSPAAPPPRALRGARGRVRRRPACPCALSLRCANGRSRTPRFVRRTTAPAASRRRLCWLRGASPGSCGPPLARWARGAWGQGAAADAGPGDAQDGGGAEGARREAGADAWLGRGGGRGWGGRGRG